MKSYFFATTSKILPAMLVAVILAMSGMTTLGLIIVEQAYAVEGEISAAGGQIPGVGGGRANFGFNVICDTDTIQGVLEFQDQSVGIMMHSDAIASCEIIGGTAQFTGTSDTNFGPVTFVARAHDNGEPGDNDIFEIVIFAEDLAIYSNSNLLVGGKIQVVQGIVN
jgi:hypothetical protein